ncbi:MAG: ATP-dependent helicase HrpB [Bacteroidales bacterium]|nr:ATP-dependent helicase HrpB [Bacteroidales bacterium]
MYPIEKILDEIYKQYINNPTIIITAPPGTGKSTILPIKLMEKINNGKIVMLEPRRLAAKTIAYRMSDLLGEKSGETVGYKIRFESNVSNKTKIEVVTEGILTRMLQTDNELSGISTIIFDEFHERSLNADLALALVRECQQILRPDLKIIIMSATIDTDNLSKLLNAPVIKAEGKMYDVKIMYEGNCDEQTVSEQVAITIVKALRSYEGDILAFLPGEAEIRRAEELLKKEKLDIALCPLYGMLPPNKQTEAILPDKNGRRKVVLATSIAETSLTIEGIKIVVDSGLCRIQKYNADSALSHLETVRISQDMADQRAGRAGRLSNGICFRLWNLAEQQRMLENRRPEIEYADLTSLTLDLAKWGEQKPENLTWITPPNDFHIKQAKELLQEIDALDDNYNITDLGVEINKIPSHPRIAKMLIKAKEYKLSPLAADIAAILDNRDPMPKDYGIDINIRIDALRRNRRDNRHNKNFDRIEQNALQYRKMFNAKQDNSEFDSYDTGLLIAEAFPERIASAKPGNNAQFMLSNGTIATTSYEDSLAHESWLAIATLNAREGMAKIFLASPLNPASLKSMLKTKESITWNTKKGGIVATTQLRIGRIVLQEKPIKNPDPETIGKAIIAALKKEGSNILDFNDEVKNLQNRILSLRIWNKDEDWPDVSTEKLLENCEEWITPYLCNARTTADLKKIDIKNAITYSLSPLLQEKLNKLAPTHLEMPSGSKIKVMYKEDGSQPVVSVRLQEVFGLLDTPKINNGKISILMHLLSPGYKPVQITSDLRSFWDNAYFEVRKELKTKYPKHVWPDNPLEEKATRGIKKK